MSNSNGAACIWTWRQASNLDLDGCLSGFRINAAGPHGSGWLLPHAVSVSHRIVTDPYPSVGNGRYQDGQRRFFQDFAPLWSWRSTSSTASMTAWGLSSSIWWPDPLMNLCTPCEERFASPFCRAIQTFE
jgi:hypothetical protein